MTARPQLPVRQPRAKGVPTALDGLLVVDFTRVVAGPACTQMLADFGAEVIKIENPEGGDDTRAYEHAELGGESAAYLSLNRGKRGIALDFARPEACEVARELIARADVVVENFSSGVMKKYGLLCVGRANKSAAGVLLDLGLWPRGTVCKPPRLRSDHAGRKRVHVAERLSGWAAGADRNAHHRHGDGNDGLQRHFAGAAGA